MTDRFLGLEQGKQQVVGIDLERFGPSQASRAIVVTAERERLSLFWSRQNGSWGAWTRIHDALDRTPRRPDALELSGWSNRVGIAAAADRLLLAYRRRFGDSNRRALWVDRLSFNATDERFSADAGTPFRVPADGLGIDRFGFSLWAGAFEARVLIVAQAWFTAAPTMPRLVLLRAALDGDLASAASWTVHDLDAGGHDFDARLVDGRLFVIHRRAPALVTANFQLPIDPGFSGPTVDIELLDQPGATFPLSSLTAPLALVQLNAASGAVLSIDATLPGGEHPRFIDAGGGAAPVTYTMDRWTRVRLMLRPIEGAPTVEFIELRAVKSLVMLAEGGWHRGDLYGLPGALPSNLADLARAQRCVGFTPTGAGQLRLELCTLIDCWPWLKLSEGAAEKGRQLVLGHHDPSLGALAAHTIDAVPDGEGRLLVTFTGITVLDINRSPLSEQIAPDATRVENAQFAPFDQRTAREQVPPPLRVVEPGRTGNTLGGLFAAHRDAPETFFACVDMGDGGARVYCDTGFTLSPPSPPDPKELTLDLVPEPAENGRAWVRLETPGRTATGLAGYGWVGTASLGTRLQEALDALSTGVALLVSDEALEAGGGSTLRRDGEARARFGPIARLELTPAAAQTIQDTAFALLPAAGPFRSGGGAPFPVAFTRDRPLVFVGEPITFTALLPEPPPGPFVHRWDFLRPDADGELQVFDTREGAVVTLAFVQATMPDLSSPGPQPDTSRITARLTVTADVAGVATESTAEARFTVSASLWADLWVGFAAFRRLPGTTFDPADLMAMAPGFETREAAVELFKYRMRYLTDPTFIGERVEIEYRESHDTEFLFRRGAGPAQGRVELHARIRSVMPASGVANASGAPAIVLTGTIGTIFNAIGQVDRLETVIRLVRGYTPGTTTSEQRDGSPRSELLLEPQLFRPDRMLASGLACKPAEPLQVAIDRIDSSVRLSTAAWISGAVVTAIVALGLAVPALIVAMALVVKAGLLVVIGVGLLGAVVALLIGAGLGLVLMWLFERFVFRPWVSGIIRNQLAGSLTRDQFLRAGMMTHAGEGLAEALAARLIDQAIADGHAVDPPQRQGRDRMRPQLFETIVVAEGGCKARMRIADDG